VLPERPAVSAIGGLRIDRGGRRNERGLRSKDSLCVIFY